MTLDAELNWLLKLFSIFQKKIWCSSAYMLKGSKNSLWKCQPLLLVY